MGIEDRDWYWKERQKRGAPEDAYFLKAQPPRRRSMAMRLIVMAALGLVCAGLWFGRTTGPDPAKVQAELRALGDSPGSVARPAAPRHGAFPQSTERRAQLRHDVEAGVDLALLILAAASPLILLGLLIATFLRPVPALVGLACGFIGLLASAGGGTVDTGLWGWIQPAPDMGSFAQFVGHAGGTFTLAALTGFWLACRQGPRRGAPSGVGSDSNGRP
jgi:hypothetical protein